MINMFLKSLALREFVTAVIDTDANPRLHVISSSFKASFSKQNSLFYRNTLISIISSFFKVSFSKQNSLFYRNTFINIFLS